MSKHFHIRKQSRTVGGGKSVIVEHAHSLKNVIANHEHEGMIGFAKTRAEIERLRDEYDARVAEYRSSLRKSPALDPVNPKSNP
jgi:hypothetical protein